MEDDRLRKMSAENREVMRNQQQSLKQRQRVGVESRKSTKKSPSNAGTSRRRGHGGTDNLSSVRRSEERSSSVHTPAPAGQRGTKRARDWEMEKVREELILYVLRLLHWVVQPAVFSYKAIILMEWYPRNKTSLPNPQYGCPCQTRSSDY